MPSLREDESNEARDRLRDAPLPRLPPADGRHGRPEPFGKLGLRQHRRLAESPELVARHRHGEALPMV